ncbi:MAG: hypothetical protein RR413_10045 [Christensenellaceae bacterium]
MKDISNLFFSVNKDETIDTIVDMGIDLTMDSMDVAKFSTNEYSKKNQETKNTILNYCADHVGLRRPESKKDLVMLFSNSSFESLFNSIVSEIQSGVMVRSESKQLLAMCNIVGVDCGDSHTWELDTKGLPVVQRASLTTNLSLVDGYSMQGITITPIPYACSSSIDYIRILANDFDFGKEMARVTKAILYAQYKLVASTIFSTTGAIASTPFYQATFASNKYVKMAEALGALNGGSGVTSYGSITAFNAISALATQGGFTTRDRYIENGYLQKIHGVDSVIMENATDLSAPLAAAIADVNLLIPSDLLVMLSAVGDKPAKLVRENYVRVQNADQNSTSLNRIVYKYFNAFNVGLCTQAHFGVQKTAA